MFRQQPKAVSPTCSASRGAQAATESFPLMTRITTLREAENMQHVFISYRHEDIDFAENVISRLEREGFTTWADSEIGAGEEWRTSIDLAIKNSFALIVIMTPRAKASEYVTYEWAFAWGVGIRVIPIMLTPTDLHPRLEALQYLDFTSAKSRPWDRLIEEVKTASYAPLTCGNERQQSWNRSCGEKVEESEGDHPGRDRDALPE
jgi:TIR domain